MAVGSTISAGRRPNGDFGGGVRLVVAHVLTSLDAGGAERMVLDLATRQVGRGYTVYVMSMEEPGDGRLAGEFRASGAHVLRIPKRRAGFDGGRVVQAARIVREGDIRIVHTHNALPLLYGTAAGKLGGARVVHTQHGAGIPSGFGRAAARVLASAVDRYVAVSLATADLVSRVGQVASSRLTVIPNGIDTARFDVDDEGRRRLRRELGIADDAWVTGTAGRLEPVKAQGLLLAAAAPLLGPRHHLVIAGDGSERDRLERDVAALGVGSFVHFLGYRPDMHQVLSCFDVFCLSSDTEGLPLAVLEAMAAGLPVVATAVGGLSEIVRDDETGWLVPPRDERTLRDRLARLHDEPEEGHRVGRLAQRLARERYDVEVMTQAYDGVYQSLV